MSKNQSNGSTKNRDRWFESENVDFAKIVFLFFTFYKFIYLIYLFLAALGLCCCVRAFSSCGERGPLFIALHRLLIAVASLAAEHGL